MVKKLFALASVSALAGLVSAVGVAGCTETKTETTPGDAGPAEKDAGKTKTDPGDDDDDDDEIPTCVSETPIDGSQFPYNPPVKTAGACTTKELQDLSAFVAEKSAAKEPIKVGAWSAVVGDSCKACVFTTEDAAAWGPLLTKDDDITSLNRGGCVEIVSGKQACGQSYQQVSECRFEACGQCKNQAEFDACLEDGQGIFTGPCKAPFDKLQADCGSSLGAYENACKGTKYVFEGPVKVQCITGGTGGGTDAGDGG